MMGFLRVTNDTSKIGYYSGLVVSLSSSPNDICILILGLGEYFRCCSAGFHLSVGTPFGPHWSQARVACWYPWRRSCWPSLRLVQDTTCVALRSLPRRGVLWHPHRRQHRPRRYHRFVEPVRCVPDLWSRMAPWCYHWTSPWWILRQPCDTVPDIVHRQLLEGVPLLPPGCHRCASIRPGCHHWPDYVEGDIATQDRCTTYRHASKNVIVWCHRQQQQGRRVCS
jgi:hypothetical protein